MAAAAFFIHSSSPVAEAFSEERASVSSMSFAVISPFHMGHSVIRKLLEPISAASTRTVTIMCAADHFSIVTRSRPDPGRTSQAAPSRTTQNITPNIIEFISTAPYYLICRYLHAASAALAPSATAVVSWRTVLLRQSPAT